MSNSSKVLVDTSSGNNMMMLPLDRLAQGAAGAALSNRSDSGARSSDFNQRDIRALTDQVISEIRARQGSATGGAR